MSVCPADVSVTAYKWLMRAGAEGKSTECLRPRRRQQLLALGALVSFTLNTFITRLPTLMIILRLFSTSLSSYDCSTADSPTHGSCVDRREQAEVVRKRRVDETAEGCGGGREGIRKTKIVLNSLCQLVQQPDLAL